MGRPRGAASSCCCTAGWMSSASFQFLVDALAGRLARDRARLARLRPHAMAPQDGYWFPDYVADLDALLRRARARRDACDLVGHSLGANVAMHLRGRAAATRVASVVALDGFGIPAEGPDARAGQVRGSGSMRCAIRRARALSRSRRGGRPAAEEQSATAARQGRVPRGALGRGAARRHGAAARRSAPQAAVSDTSTGWRRSYAIWRDDRAPVLWVAAADSDIPRWLAGGGDARAPRSRGASRTCRTASSSPSPTPGTCCITTSPRPLPASIEAFSRRDRAVMRGAFRAVAARRLRRAGLLTLIWGCNWIFDEARAAQRRSGRVQRAAHMARGRSCCSPCCVATRRRCWPRVVAGDRSSPASSRPRSTSARRRWRLPAAARGARRCWCSRCRSGRCCIAWPVLHERVRGQQWFAVGFALAGLDAGRRAVELARRSRRRSCGRCCRASAWAAGTVATKYFQRESALDALNFIAWQMLVGVLPLTLLPLAATCRRCNGASRYALLLLHVGARVDGTRLPAVGGGAALCCPPAPRRSTCSRFR